MIFLKELYMNLPTLLKKRIAINVSVAALAFILFFIVGFSFLDIKLALPCLFFTAILIVKAAILFYNCITGNYLEIKGVCSEVEKTLLSKRIKSITLYTEDKKLKLNTYYSIKNINVGDCIIVYISKKSPLYNQNGFYIANEFYGITVDKED